MVDHKNPGPATRTVWSFQGSELFTFLLGIFTECVAYVLAYSPQGHRSTSFRLAETGSLLGAWVHAIL